jgi:hypothetical protein
MAEAFEQAADQSRKIRSSKPKPERKAKGKKAKAPKLVVTTFAEIQAQEMVPPELEIVLPDELLAMESDPKFVAKQTAVELREQAFQALDDRNGNRARYDELQDELNAKNGRYVTIHKAYWDVWQLKHPGTAKWINSMEPSCVAHRAQVDKFIDLAAAKVDKSVEQYLKLKSELAEVNEWLKVHGSDHMSTFAKAEKVCQDAGVDYFRIWPRKESNAKA